MAHILIVDDNPDFRYALERIVRRMEHISTSYGSFEEGKADLLRNTYDAVFLDVMLPDGNGLDLLPILKNSPSQPETIIITGMGDSQGAEMAITNGAWDYISKSKSSKEISLTLSQALKYREQKMATTRKTGAVALRREGIIGTSPAITDCFDQLAHCTGSDVNVVISGDTGTGKELFARAIHDNSLRANGPFVVLDCASLPDTLIESTLFGYKKGAFTGANSNSTGLIIKANGGTLFLDEVGELPLTTQKSFLRVLQERTVRPVGSTEEVQCDFRMVAATNRNLEEMTKEGLFRRDLFYRLQAYNIHLPPLRFRGNDVADIITYHIVNFCDSNNMERKVASAALFEVLTEYDWPGNVRELVNCIHQTVINAGIEPILYPKHLPLGIRIKATQAALGTRNEQDKSNSVTQLTTSASLLGDTIKQQTLQEYREVASSQAEHDYLQTLLSVCGNDIKEVIRISGLSQSRLYALLKKYDLRANSKK